VSGVQVMLILLDLDGHCCNVIIELSVLGNLSSEAPIPGVSHSFLQDLEVAAWTGEHMPKPRWEGFERGVDAVVGGGVTAETMSP
jgi:hypothetical protein